MKSLATIFLTAIIFLQTFSPYIIRADFSLNRSFIAKTLCINREKPMMHCNGKCYLSKKLKEQEKQDQQVPAPKNEQVLVQPFFVPAAFILSSPQRLDEIKFFITNDDIAGSFPHTIFHPPTV